MVAIIKSKIISIIVRDRRAPSSELAREVYGENTPENRQKIQIHISGIRHDKKNPMLIESISAGDIDSRKRVYVIPKTNDEYKSAFAFRSTMAMGHVRSTAKVASQWFDTFPLEDVIDTITNQQRLMMRAMLTEKAA